MEGRIALFLGVLFIVSISSDNDCAEVVRKNSDLVE